MKNYTDEELAEMAQWAEECSMQGTGEGLVSEAMARLNGDKRKAFAAIRQGIDWLLRVRILERQHGLHTAGQVLPPPSKVKQ